MINRTLNRETPARYVCQLTPPYGHGEQVARWDIVVQRCRAHPVCGVGSIPSARTAQFLHVHR